MKKTSYTLLILSAILALALNLLLSLTGNFLTARLEPYQTWIYWGLAIVFLSSRTLLINGPPLGTALERRQHEAAIGNKDGEGQEDDIEDDALPFLARGMEDGG